MPLVETVSLPELRVDVLTEPLTRDEYKAATDVDDLGVITRVVSVDFQSLVGVVADTVYDALAADVLDDLSGDWTIYSYRVVGADPRYAGTPHEGTYVLVQVAINPGYDD